MALLEAFKGIRLKNKILITFTALNIVALIILQSICYRLASDKIEELATDFSSLAVARISGDIDKTLHELDRLSQTALSNPALIRALKSDSLSSAVPAYSQVTADAINAILYLRSDIHKVYLYGVNGNVYLGGTDNYLPYAYRPEDEPWYRDFVESPALMTILSPHYPEQLYSLNYKVFSVVRKIRQAGSSEIVGMIKIDLKTTVFEQTCQTGRLNEDAVFIFDANGDTIYRRGSLLPDQAFLDNLSGHEGSFRIRLAGDPKIVTYLTSSFSDWTVALVISENVLLKDIRAMRTSTLLFIPVCALLVFLGALVISSAVTSSTEILLSEMKKVEGGDLTVEAKVRSNDEIGMLTKGFNNMVSKISVLTTQNLDIQLKRREAELMSLQEQISPHFLYNTLDAIRMKAVINRDEDAAEMIEELSGLLRLSLQGRSELIRLEDELTYIEKYVRLLNMRYKQKFTLLVEIPESLRRMPIPAFLFQPLIENAVRHGLEPLKSGRRVTMAGEARGDKVYIQISDNGIGMDAERLTEVRRSLGSGGGGIGLANVQARIRLYYGEGYGLSVESSAGEGTTITAVLPLPDHTSGGELRV